MLRSAVPFVAVTAILFSVSSVVAQNNFGGSGAFGGGTGFGGGGFGGGGQGASSFGASGFGASGFGASGFGASGFGGNQFGGQFGGQGALGGSGTGSNTPFVGRGSETAFVGRGTGQTNNNSRFNPVRQRSGGDSSESSAGAARRPPVRVRLRPSADLIAGVRPTVGASTVSRRNSRMAGVTMETRAGVTVLEGVVDTPSQRLVAEKLAALEPGVGAIENRLRLRAEAVELLPRPR